MEKGSTESNVGQHATVPLHPVAAAPGRVEGPSLWHGGLHACQLINNELKTLIPIISMNNSIYTCRLIAIPNFHLADGVGIFHPIFILSRTTFFL